MDKTKSPFKLRTGPDGLHLFNRTTGLNILIDEIKPPIDSWSIAPRQLSVALTNLCDLNCSYCYAPKYPARLNSDLLCGWLDELDADGCLSIGFGGGEPTLYPDFLDICRYAAKSTKMAVTFTTHGLRLDEQLAADLKDASLIDFLGIEGKVFHPDDKYLCFTVLPGAQFLWLILQHVLPKGFRRTRNFGFLHANSKRVLALLQDLLRWNPIKILVERALRPTIKCPCCGGAMRIVKTRIPALSEFGLLAPSG